MSETAASAWQPNQEVASGKSKAASLASRQRAILSLPSSCFALHVLNLCFSTIFSLQGLLCSSPKPLSPCPHPFPDSPCPPSMGARSRCGCRAKCLVESSGMSLHRGAGCSSISFVLWREVTSPASNSPASSSGAKLSLLSLYLW